ncbi:MAG: hypothetical protein ACO3Q1_04370 [Candidatus Nanopelagicales bacterium]|jgi:hypothetical protein|nr:hypothetical protein [Candidatus Nanopelagicaceae bacterium]
MRKGLLARSAVAALAFSLMSATGAIAQDKSAGRNPVDKAEKVKAITDAIGIDSESLKTKRQAGESLATIAGSKVDALLAALLAFDSKKIDAAVASGKITTIQATELKAKLITRVNEVANRIGKKVETDKSQRSGGN